MRRLLILLWVLGSFSVTSTLATEVFARPPERPPVKPPKPKPLSQSTGLAVTVQVIPSAPINYATWLGPGEPNPFDSSTIIRYSCAKPGIVTVRVYSIQGRLVATLVNRFHSAGTYSLWWDGRGGGGQGRLASGVYLCRMIAGTYAQSRRLVLVR